MKKIKFYLVAMVSLLFSSNLYGYTDISGTLGNGDYTAKIDYTLYFLTNPQQYDFIYINTTQSAGGLLPCTPIPCGYGIYLNSSIYNLNTVDINTTGWASDAIVVKRGASKLKINERLIINTTGLSADGVNVGDESSNAVVDVGDGAFISTKSGVGLRANSAQNAGDINQIIAGNDLEVITFGSGSNAADSLGYAVYSGNRNSGHANPKGGSKVTIGNNSVIKTHGSNAHAFYANKAGQIELGSTNVSTNGSGAHAFAAESAGKIYLTGNADVKVAKNNAYAFYTSGLNSSIKSSGSHIYNVEGNIYSQNGGLIDLDMSDGSLLDGNTKKDATSQLNIKLNGSNSRWYINANSTISELTLSGSNVYLGNRSNGSTSTSAVTLEVDTLFGNGNIHKRIDIDGTGSSAVNNGDLLIIHNSSSGNFNLNFYDVTSGGATVNGNESLLVVQQNTTVNSNYAALHYGSADIGAYTFYVLSGDTSNNESAKNQYLKTPQLTLNNAAQKSLSFLNINYLMGIIETQTLMQRMGELEINRDYTDDVWAKGYVGRLHNFKDIFGIDKTDYYGLQAGIDRKYQGRYLEGDYYLGFMIGYTNANIDYDVGNGEVDSYHAGIYGSYKDPNGFYLDSVIKYTYMKNDFNTLTSNNYLINGDGDTKGVGVSAEIGKRFDIKETNFYLEPQAQISYTYQDNMDVHSSTGLVTKINRHNSVIARGSMLFGYKNDSINLYYKTGYISDMNGRVSYRFNNGEEFEHKVNGNWWDNAIGITKTIDNRHHIHVEATYQYGDEFNNIKLNGGYRYKF